MADPAPVEAPVAPAEALAEAPAAVVEVPTASTEDSTTSVEAPSAVVASERSWAMIAEEEEEGEPTHPDIGITVLVNQEVFVPPDNFDELGIPLKLLTALYDKGYNNPSSVQAASIPLMAPEMEGDLIAQAPSGSGKTAAIAVGMLMNIEAKTTKLQSICIAHTRELAIQTFRYIRKVAEMTGIKMAIGIPSYSDKSSVAEEDLIPHFAQTIQDYQILVGCPGTLVSLLKKKKDLTKDVKTVVIDEADEFLVGDGRLMTDSAKVKKACKDARVFLFSATFGDDVMKLTSKFIGNKPPRWVIRLQGHEFHKDSLLQRYLVARSPTDKQAAVCSIYENTSEAQSILFCEKRDTCNVIEKALLTAGDFSVGKLHGGLAPNERDQMLKKFRSGETHHLVCTNVLARGIDIPTISLVINYDLPRINKSKELDVSTYIHRVGRCTRWRNKGMAINFISPDEISDIQKLQATGGFEVQELRMEGITSIEVELDEFRKTG